MKRGKIAKLLAGLFAVAACLSVPLLLQSGQEPPWIAENHALDAQYMQAMAGGNIDSIMACWSKSPDALLVAFGNISQGPVAIRAFYTATASPPGTNVSSEDFNVRYWRVGELVFGVGTVTNTVTPPGGAPFSFLDVWSDVRRKENGRWVYILDHAEMLPVPE